MVVDYTFNNEGVGRDQMLTMVLHLPCVYAANISALQFIYMRNLHAIFGIITGFTKIDNFSLFLNPEMIFLGNESVFLKAEDGSH